VPHPLGAIEVRLERTAGGGLRAAVTLPPGLEGVLVCAERKPPCDPDDRNSLSEAPRTHARRGDGRCSSVAACHALRYLNSSGERSRR
jgi:hypothetical protein